jgi:hypothetical protein
MRELETLNPHEDLMLAVGSGRQEGKKRSNECPQ